MAHPTPLEDPTRLSQSVVWDLQRRYYTDRGPRAWDREVPFYVTTNAYLAAAYAKAFVAWVEDVAAADAPLGPLNREQPVTIVEFGAGSGRLGYLLARELDRLRRDRELPPFRLVLTDVVEANVASWGERYEFRPLLDAGVVDFAHFDAENPGPLTLRHSGEVIGPGDLANPLGVVANYVIDSLRQDAFAAAGGTLQEILVQAALPEGSRSADDPEATRDVVLLRQRREAAAPYYDDPGLDSLLTRYREGFEETEFLVPVSGIGALRYLSQLSGDRMLVIAGDRGISRMPELDGRALGPLTKHASFSVLANLDAIGHVTTQRSGRAWFHGNRYTEFTVAAFATSAGSSVQYPRFSGAFREHLDSFGPPEYHRWFKVRRNAAKEGPPPSVSQVLVWVRLSRFDAGLFTKFGQVLVDGAAAANRAVQQDLLHCIDEVAKRSYRMGRADDARFVAGRVLHRMQRYTRAVELFTQVTQAEPERRAAWFNLGLCHEQVGRRGEARRSFEEALRLDPSYEKAKEALARVG